MRHLLDIDDLHREDIVAILDLADQFQANPPTPPLPLRGKVVGLFFFQPSTRTRMGFNAAAARLGATGIDLTQTRYESGMSEPESLLDTFKSSEVYCDLIILRHSKEEAFFRMVQSSYAPIISGGCGTSSHPTQSLVDLYAIRSHFKKLNGLRIGVAGDLACSRSGKSFIKAMTHFSPKLLRLMTPSTRNIDQFLIEVSTLTEYTEQLEVEGLDLLYMAGFPPGEGQNYVEDKVRAPFKLDRKNAKKLPEHSLILSPLPRIDEISSEVDDLPQAKYFEQNSLAQNVRLAVLSTVWESVLL